MGWVRKMKSVSDRLGFIDLVSGQSQNQDEMALGRSQASYRICKDLTRWTANSGDPARRRRSARVLGSQRI